MHRHAPACTSRPFHSDMCPTDAHARSRAFRPQLCGSAVFLARVPLLALRPLPIGRSSVFVYPPTPSEPGRCICLSALLQLHTPAIGPAAVAPRG